MDNSFFDWDSNVYSPNSKSFGSRALDTVGGVAIREFSKALIIPIANKLKNKIEQLLNKREKTKVENVSTVQSKEQYMGTGNVQSVEDFVNMIDGVEIVPLWNGLLYAGEIAFLIGDSGSGKSPLCLQLASDLSFGKDSSLFPTAIVPPATKVIYYDYEMSPATWRKRYPDHSVFSKIERINSTELLKSDALIADIKKRIASFDGNMLFVVDTLASFDRSFLSKGAQEMLRQVKIFRDDALKEKRLLTFVFLNHLDEKKRKKILEKEDVYGSAIQYKLADCVIGVGKTALDDYYKYIKLLKTRMGVLPQSVSLVQSYKNSEKDNLKFRYIGEYDENLLISNKIKNLNKALIIEEPKNAPSEDEVVVKYGKRRIPITVVIEMKVLKETSEQSYENIVKYMKNVHPQYDIKYSADVVRVINKLDDYLKQNNIDWDSLQVDILFQKQVDDNCIPMDENDIELGDPEQMDEINHTKKIDLSDFAASSHSSGTKKRKRIKYSHPS